MLDVAGKQVECICNLYPGSEMVKLLEEQPKILVHGFGRISRVVYAAKVSKSCTLYRSTTRHACKPCRTDLR